MTVQVEVKSEVIDVTPQEEHHEVESEGTFIKGDRGASAFEVAVASGFKGSEEEWLESLKGSNANVTTENIVAALGYQPANENDIADSAEQALKDSKAYTDQQIQNIPTPDVSGQIDKHNTNADAHEDIRLLITGLTTRLNALANSDDTTLDQMAEVVAYIKSNRTLIESVTTDKVNVSDIINNLTTNVANKPLSAAQGVVLKNLIDTLQTAVNAIKVPTKTSELTDDVGFAKQTEVDSLSEEIADLNNAEQDTAILGAELANANNWTLGTGWSGSFASGFTHASGNTAPLTFTPTITAGKLYQVTFKSSVRMTTTNLFVQVGNSTKFNLYGEDSTNETLNGNVSIGVLAVDTTGLVFTPESNFTGTLTNISIKEITGNYEAIQQYFDTNEAVAYEIHVTPRGLENVYIGQATGEMNTTGHENVGIGVNVLTKNTSGFWNVGIGKDCLKNNTGGSRNLALGYNALLNNEVGQRNVALGTFAMTSMKNGNWNIAIGSDSMNESSGGNKNVAVGFNTLVHNNADNNVAVGADVLADNTTGAGNVGIGLGALTNNTTGHNNVCIGYNAGVANTTATGNVGVGWASLYKTTTGARNTAIGYAAGKALTTGKYNIVIGAEKEVEPTGNYQLNIGDLLKGSLVSGAAYLSLNGGLKLPNIPTTAQGGDEVYAEEWTFTLEDGSTVTKKVLMK